MTDSIWALNPDHTTYIICSLFILHGLVVLIVVWGGVLCRYENRVQWFDFGFPTWADKVRSGPFKDMFSSGNLAYALDWLCDLEKMNAMLLLCRGYEIGGDCTQYCSPCVLCHGDVRLDNCFFDDNRDVCWLVDWQVCAPRHPLTDISYAFAEAKLEILEDPVAVRSIVNEYVEALDKSTRASAAVASSKTDEASTSTTTNRITTDEIMSLLPMGCMFTMYLLVIFAMAASSDMDKELVDRLHANFRRCDAVFKTYGIPKLPKKRVKVNMNGNDNESSGIDTKKQHKQQTSQRRQQGQGKVR